MAGCQQLIMRPARLDVACVIRNDGDGPARGPLAIAQSIDY